MTLRSDPMRPLVFLVPLALCAAIAFCRASAYFGDDAAGYVDAARGLVSGRGFVTNNETAALPSPIVPTVGWPPGYPFLIATLAAVGIDPVRASWWIGLASYAGIIAMCALIAQRAGSAGVAWIAGALLALSPRLWTFATGGLSEMPFTLAVLLAVLAIDLRSNVWRVAILAAAMAATPYLRYVGVFLFPAVICIALFARTRLSLRQALLVCILAGLAFAPWVLRNIAVSASVGGERPAAERALFENLSDAGIGTANLLVPTSFFSALEAHTGRTSTLIAGLVLACATVWLLLRTCRTAPSALGEERNAPVLRALAIVSLAYLVVLVVLRSLMYFDPLTSERLLLPLLPLLALLAARGLVDAWKRARTARALAVAASLGYVGLAVVLGARGPFLRVVYPDLDDVASAIQAHVPAGSCLAYEQPTTEGLWGGHLVRMRLPQYRAVYVPDTLFTHAGTDLARALGDWGRATGCAYLISVAHRRAGAGEWTFPEGALDQRVHAAPGAAEGRDRPILELVYRSPRLSIIHVVTAAVPLSETASDPEPRA